MKRFLQEFINERVLGHWPSSLTAVLVALITALWDVLTPVLQANHLPTEPGAWSQPMFWIALIGLLWQKNHQPRPTNAQPPGDQGDEDNGTGGMRFAGWLLFGLLGLGVFSAQACSFRDSTADQLLRDSATVLESTRAVNNVVRKAYDTGLLKAETASKFGQALALFHNGHGAARVVLKGGWQPNGNEWHFYLSAEDIGKLQGALIEMRGGLQLLLGLPESNPLIDGAAIALNESANLLMARVRKLKPTRATLRFDDNDQLNFVTQAIERDNHAYDQLTAAVASLCAVKGE